MKPSSHARVDAAVVGANLPARTPDCARWEFLLRAWSVSDGLLPRLNQGKRAEVESHQASFAAFSALRSQAVSGKAAIHQGRGSTASVAATDSPSRSHTDFSPL